MAIDQAWQDNGILSIDYLLSFRHLARMTSGNTLYRITGNHDPGFLDGLLVLNHGKQGAALYNQVISAFISHLTPFSAKEVCKKFYSL